MLAEAATAHFELRRAGKPIPTNDLWIAALCRQHHLSLLSRGRIKEVEEGIWLVSFMDYDLGYIDFEEKNSAASRKRFWRESVTHVSGTIYNLCVRAGPP
jgi:hypothetical protein